MNLTSNLLFVARETKQIVVPPVVVQCRGSFPKRSQGSGWHLVKRYGRWQLPILSGTLCDPWDSVVLIRKA